MVVAAVRNPEKAGDLGVATVPFDYDREETLAPALRDIDSVLMLTGYTVDMFAQSKTFLNAARRAGVRHSANHSPTSRDHRRSSCKRSSPPAPAPPTCGQPAKNTRPTLQESPEPGADFAIMRALLKRNGTSWDDFGTRHAHTLRYGLD
jgi:hypothetical protein